MSRLLALEWDTQEARLAVGRRAGRRLIVEAAFAVGTEEVQGASLRDRLAAKISELGLGRGDWLIAVPRSRAELRVLQLPLVPDNELPDLVRFQAFRQFSTLSEDALLDFVRLDGGQASQLRVLAAALTPHVLSDVKACCTACQGNPHRLVLRPFASASLFRRKNQDSQPRLLVEMLAEEADLTVLIGGQPALVRSVRLPSEDRATSLVSEIRRTIVAAQNQAGEEAVRVVTLVGDSAELTPLRDRLASQLEMDVEIFDPFNAVEVGDEILATPVNPGRYAALFGMLADEAEGRPHGIDFLNPRRPPKPPNRRLRFAVLGGVAAACAAVLIIMVLTYMHQYSTRIENLQSQSQELDEQVKIAKQVEENVAEIDKFVLADVNWLDELYRLSEKFPPPDEAMVELAAFNAIPSGGGQILLEGYVSDPAVIRDMEIRLSDGQHEVTGTGSQLDERRSEHPWEFKEKITVQSPDIEALTQQAMSDEGADKPLAEAETGKAVEDASEAEKVEGEQPAEQDPGKDDAPAEESADEVVEQSVEEGSGNEQT